MLIGACLEALVGIGDAILAFNHPPTFPGTGDAAGLLSGVMLKSHRRSGNGSGVRRSGRPDSGARSSSSPRDSGRAYGHSSALSSDEPSDENLLPALAAGD